MTVTQSNIPDRFLNKREVCEMLKLSPMSLWRREFGDGKTQPDPYFPKRVYLSSNKSVWRLSDVLDWMDKQCQKGKEGVE